MKKSSCRGLPTTVAGKIASRRCAICLDVEHRVVVLQRVVAVVIAERSFGPPHVRRDTSPISANSALAMSGCGPGASATRASRSPAMSDASISSGTFSGSGAIAARISAGGPPRNTVTGSGCRRGSATA